MKKKFITGLILYIFLNLIIKSFWIFGIEVSVQNTVGANDYGLYFSLFGLSFLLNIILDAGITNYNNRNIARYNHLLSKSFSNIVTLKLLLGIIYAIICLTIGISLKYDFLQFKLLFFLIFNQFLASFILYLRSNISGLLYFKTDSILSVLDRLVLIIICSLLLWANITQSSFRIEWFIYAQTFSYLISAIVAFVVVLHKCEYFSLRLNYPFLLVILKQSYPFALLILFMAVYNRIDSVMLEYILRPEGKTQAGIYAQAFRLQDAVAQFGFLFAGLLLPIYSKMLKEKANIENLLKFSYLLILIPAIIISISAFFYSKEIMGFLYHQHIEDSAVIFIFLMFGFVCIATTYIFGSLLTANKNLKQLNLLAATAVVINVILNGILIPRYLAVGSAIASLCTQFFMAVSQVILAKNVFQLRVNWNIVIRLCLYIFSLLITGHLLKMYMSDELFGLVVLVAAGMALAIMIKLFNLKELFGIIRSKELD